MAVFIRRERSSPGRSAKLFLGSGFFGDVYELRCIRESGSGHHRVAPRGLAMRGFGRTSPGRARMVSGVG